MQVETNGFLFPALLNQTNPPPDSDFFSVRSLAHFSYNICGRVAVDDICPMSMSYKLHCNGWKMMPHLPQVNPTHHLLTDIRSCSVQPVLNTSAADGGMPDFNTSYIYNIMLCVLKSAHSARGCA